MRTVFAIIALVLTTGTASAEPLRTPGNFGLGIGSGTLANGLSAKYFIDTSHALQFNLGAFGGRGLDNRWHRFGGVGVSADYLFEMPTIVRAGNAFELAWNVGLGLGLGFDNDDYVYKDERYNDYVAVGASFVLGLELNFLALPIDIVIEYRPGLFLSPYLDFNPVDFTGHVRFYF